MKPHPLSELFDVTIGYRPKSGGTDGSDLGIPISALDHDREFIDEFPVPAPGRLWFGGLEPVDSVARSNNYYVQEGDVLFLARGSRRIAAPVLPNYVQPWPPEWGRTMVLYYFFILRPISDKVLPDFLAWSINEGPLHASIEALAEGTLVQKVSVKDFRELEITVPPLKTQRHILEIYELALRERRLTERLGNLRREYAAGACNQLLRYINKQEES